MFGSRLQQRIGFEVERSYPAALGIAIGAIAFMFGHEIFNYGAAHNIHFENTYAAAAGVFAIIAGFLASFYGSIQAIADVRLARISKAPFFKRFLFQIKEATIAGFLISLLSLPFIIVSPDAASFFSRSAIAVWIGLSIYSFMAFVRVGLNLFYVFEHMPPLDDGA